MTQIVLAAIVALSPLGAYGLKIRDADPCACMNFHSVYKTGAATCGDANETENDCLLTGANPVVWYPMQNHRFCVNMIEADAQPKTGDERTWCYVSVACQNLNGGQILNSNVSQKICGESDQKLRDLSPMVLAKMMPYFNYRKTAAHTYAWEGPGMTENPANNCTMSINLDPLDYGMVWCNDEQWSITKDWVNCTEGCAQKLSISRIDEEADQSPAVEAWMYGPSGPPPLGDARTEDDMKAKFPDGVPRIYTQNEKNTFPLDEDDEWDPSDEN